MADGINVSSAGVAVGGSNGVNLSPSAGGACCCGACECYSGTSRRNLLVTFSGITPCAPVGTCFSDVFGRSQIVTTSSIDGSACLYPNGYHDIASPHKLCDYARGSQGPLSGEYTGVCTYAVDLYGTTNCTGPITSSVNATGLFIFVGLDDTGASSTITIYIDDGASHPILLFIASGFVMGGCSGSVTIAHDDTYLPCATHQESATAQGGTATLEWSNCT